jgi:hypothetical protein
MALAMAVLRLPMRQHRERYRCDFHSDRLKYSRALGSTDIARVMMRDAWLFPGSIAQVSVLAASLPFALTHRSTVHSLEIAFQRYACAGILPGASPSPEMRQAATPKQRVSIREVVRRSMDKKWLKHGLHNQSWWETTSIADPIRKMQEH